MKIKRIILLVALMGSVAWAHDHQAAASSHTIPDAQAIVRSMKKLFDKRDAPLAVAPVSIDGDYAVAGWIQQGRGGRALLKKENGKWSIQVCGGDGLKQASALTMIGMDRSLADKLARKVVAAEKNLSADQLKKFAMFEGVMRVDDSAHAPHGTAHEDSTHSNKH